MIERVSHITYISSEAQSLDTISRKRASILVLVGWCIAKYSERSIAQKDREETLNYFFLVLIKTL